MENAADALKMAAAVLIFVVALTISINAFTGVSQASKIILDYKDREYDNEYIGEYETEKERTVNIESIIPAIYKSYAENYKIVFPGITLYEKRDSSYDKVPINYIDLRVYPSLGSTSQRNQFIQAILYGTISFGSDKTNIYEEYNKMGIILTDNGIIDELKNNTFKEKLGIYYQEETYDEATRRSIPRADWNKKRIITYEK